MHTPRQALGRLFARFELRIPERLWVHYCLALGVILCLFIAMHTLNRTINERGVLVTASIKNSYAKVIIAQEIMIMADRLVAQTTPDFAAFNKSVSQLQATHFQSITTNQSLSGGGNIASTKDEPLFQHITAFILLATAFSEASPVNHDAAYHSLQSHYTNTALHAALLKSANTIEQNARAESIRLNNIQSMLISISVVALLAEALLIFWPAHRLVKKTIHKMQKQTQILRASKAQLKDANAQLEHIVHHDQLTGLPNRASLTKYLSENIFVQGEGHTALLLVGLDAFKSVNDMFGHDYGDSLLIAVSQALTSCVDYDNMVAHVGGDEFVLISDEAPTSLVRRIQEVMREPFEINGRRIPINASIGHMQLGDTKRQALDILADAEVALRFAKSSGGNRAQAFTTNLRKDLSLMQKMQMELRDAIKNGEIEPWFQPQVRLSDGQLHGAEVLARWRHPTRGLIPPDTFLPAAERAGLMIDLDHAIWTSAMDHAVDWQDADIWRPSISLNAAPDTIADPHLIERFLLALQRSGLDTDQVNVEVLETTLINGKDDMAAINIDSLAECGIALELDDFGTGYASLSKLTQLPLSGIKLDRSLITPLPDQAADSVVRAILALAVELGLQVVAEGVEENAQAEHLNARGCGVGQGYGFGKPMPPDEFKAWLAAHAKTTLHAGQEAAGTRATT